MNDRRLIGALLLGCGLLAALLVWVLAADGVAVDGPAPPRPAPVARRATPARAGARVSLPRPKAPDARPRLDPNTKYELNATVDEVVRASRADCLAPWAGALPDPHEVEFVLDVVTVDGTVTDFGFRAPDGEEVPADVVACVADAVWAVDWPRFSELTGETRLQRSFTVAPVAP